MKAQTMTEITVDDDDDDDEICPRLAFEYSASQF